MKADAYITIEPRWHRYWDGHLERIVATKVGSKKPRVIPSGAVVVHVVLDMPEQAFMPLEPTATVTVGMPELEIGVEVEPPA